MTYSIVLFDFKRGQTIQTLETGKFTSAEVVPSTDRGENDTQKSFLVSGSSHLKQAASKQTIKIQGSLAYENGFTETVTQDFCQEMVLSSNPADPLGTWNTCDQGAMQLEKLRK